MIDSSAGAWAARLRRIAAAEITRHRDTLGFLGAALEGSLATGAVWPTSDVDFTVVPLPHHTRERLFEWEQREALPFPKEFSDRRLHIDVCGQREGVPWHKHLTDARALQDMVQGYPASFIRLAEGPYDPAPTWFLDGLAVMEVIEDPEGLLAATQQFVAAHRFAPEVWEGRRSAFLHELRRRRDGAQEAMERGEADALSECLGSGTGFAAVAAQLWLESARRIGSSKEQDGQLAAATAAAGWPEAHALYHLTLAVQPECARLVAPLLLDLGDRAAALYRSLGSSSPEDAGRRRELTVWGAYVSHLAGTLALAPERGHPAYVYQSLRSLSYWAIDYPARIMTELQEKEVRNREILRGQTGQLAELAEQIRTTLLGPLNATDRARSSLEAADRLLVLTETRLA
jgi:hypothetical protein